MEPGNQQKPLLPDAKLYIIMDEYDRAADWMLEQIPQASPVKSGRGKFAGQGVDAPDDQEA